jgi:hypothetical protein
MIWPLTSLTAGQMLIISIVLFVLLVEMIFKRIYTVMNASSDKTVLQVLENDDKDELKRMLEAVDEDLPYIGQKAIIPVGIFLFAVMYMLAKMFICSCACNNCP